MQSPPPPTPLPPPHQTHQNPAPPPSLSEKPSLYTLPRHLTGYGAHPPSVTWPGNSRIALSFVLNYEEGAERAVPPDQHPENYLWEWAGAASTSASAEAAAPAQREGRRNFIAEQDYEYGSRIGCWRVLRLLNEFGWKGTLFLVASAGEQNPAFVHAAVEEAGWDVAAHGQRWVDMGGYGLGEVWEEVTGCVRRIQRLLGGKMPVGVYYGRVSEGARAVYPAVWKALGGRLGYSSEAYNDDQPYWVDLPWEEGEGGREGMLVVPYNQDCNDANFHIPPGFVSSNGDTYFNYLKDTFDCLYREGGKMMNVPLHPRIAGKPGRSEALRRFLGYVKGHEGVWVATREEIATFWKEKFPYEGGG